VLVLVFDSKLHVRLNIVRDCLHVESAYANERQGLLKISIFIHVHETEEFFVYVLILLRELLVFKHSILRLFDDGQTSFGIFLEFEGITLSFVH
jgi:hypothetical protein